MEFKATEPNISISDIREFEKNNNIKLPIDYEENLLKNNGG